MNENKRSKSHRQKQLVKLFGGRPQTLYQSELVLIFAYQLGLLLSRLAYWEGKQSDEDGWIYKTAKQMQRETGLTPANQKYAIRKGKELGIIEVTYRQVPRKRHYRVLWTKVAEIAERESFKYGLMVTKELMELGENKPTNTKNEKTTSKNPTSATAIVDNLPSIDQIKQRKK